MDIPSWPPGSAGQGFVSLVFNFRGCGPSQGNIDMPGWTHDLEAAIDFLHMLPEVDRNKIYLLGSSGGAAACIYAAAHNKRVSAVATLACPAEFDFMAGGYTAGSLVEQVQGDRDNQGCRFSPFDRRNGSKGLKQLRR